MEPGNHTLCVPSPEDIRNHTYKVSLWIIAVQSIAITAATLIGFVIGLNRVGSVEEARTIAYMVLVLSELIRAFSARSFEGYVFKMGLFSNRFLAYSTLIGIALMLVTVYVPPIAAVFKNVPPTSTEFAYIIWGANSALTAGLVYGVHEGLAPEETISLAMAMAYYVARDPWALFDNPNPFDEITKLRDSIEVRLI